MGAENGTRTRDPDLGKVVLYQLSYFRNNSLSKNYIHFVFGTSNGGAKLNYFFICANKIGRIFISNEQAIPAGLMKIIKPSFQQTFRAWDLYELYLPYLCI
jgi:hypothetical protein